MMNKVIIKLTDQRTGKVILSKPTAKTKAEKFITNNDFDLIEYTVELIETGEKMYQVYAIMKDGSHYNIGQPLATQREAHDFIKDCLALLDQNTVDTFEFIEVEVE